MNQSDIIKHNIQIKNLSTQDLLNKNIDRNDINDYYDN